MPPFPLCLIANETLVIWSTIIFHWLTANPPDLEHNDPHTTLFCGKPQPMLRNELITILRSHVLRLYDGGYTNVWGDGLGSF